MRAVGKKLRDERRVDVEVHTLDRWVLSEARPVGDRERPALGERSLLPPRRPAIGDGSVYEDHRRPLAQTLDVEFRQATISARARARTRAPSSHCSGAVYSAGEWLMP